MRMTRSSFLIWLAMALLVAAVLCSAPAAAGDSGVNPGRAAAAVDGGYVVAGGVSTGDTNRLYLLKTDLDGNAVWCKKTSLDNRSVGAAAVLALADGYLVTGSIGAENGSSIYLLKADPVGNIVWIRTWGAPNRYHNVYSIVATGDGYVISGQYPIKNDFHEAVGRIILTKTDLQGNPIWYRDYDGPGMAAGRSVIALPDGYLVAGDTYYGEDTSDIYLLRTDLNGNQLWNRTFTGPIEDGSSTIAVPGGFLVVGNSWGPHAMNPKECTINLLRTDLNGVEVWEKTYLVSPGYDMGKSVIAADGGYVIAGISNMYSNRTLVLLKIDESGNKLWDHSYPQFNLSKVHGSDFEPGTVSMISDDGGYIVIGGPNIARYQWYNYSLYMLRTDRDGNQAWIRSYDEIMLADGDYFRPLAPLPTPVPSPGNSGGNIAISRAVPVAAAPDGYVVGGRIRFANGSREEANGTVLDFTDYPYLLKTDLKGNVDWVRVYDRLDNTGRNDDRIDSIGATSDGYLLATSSDRSNGSSIRVSKTDLNGSILWTRAYGDTDHSYYVYSVVPVSDGYLIDGLSLTAPGDFPAHGFLLKINQVGDLVWFRYMDERGLDMVHSLTAVPDGYVLPGFEAPDREYTQAGLFKIDLNGTTVWNTTVNSSVSRNAWYTTDACSVVAVKDGYAAAGLSWEPHAALGSQKSGAYLFKTDTNGSFVWDRKYLVSGGVDRAYSVAAVKDGYLVAGIADKYGQVYNRSRIFILKANPDGSPEWNVTFTGTADDYVSAAVALSDGYLIAGQNNLQGESGKVKGGLHLIRTDMSGNVVWDKTYADFPIPAAPTSMASPATGPILLVTPTPVPTATPVVNATPLAISSPLPTAMPSPVPGYSAMFTLAATTLAIIALFGREYGQQRRGRR